MTTAAKSLFFFGLYAISAGLLFLIIPEKVIALANLPSLPAGWARVIGLLALVIGSYDIFCSRQNIRPFIQASVYVRLGFFAGTVILFALCQMPASVLAFGVVDALGAAWTALALRGELASTAA